MCTQRRRFLSRIWGTYYGDAGDEIIHSTATATNGDVLVCGYSTSTLNIATPGSQQPFNAGYMDDLKKHIDNSLKKIISIKTIKSLCSFGYLAGIF